MDSIDDRLAKIEEHGKRLDTKIDALDRKLDMHVDRVEAKIEEQGNRLDAKIDVQIEAVRDDIRSLGEGLVALGERMDRRFADAEARAAADRSMFLDILGNHGQRISTLEHDRS